MSKDNMEQLSTTYPQPDSARNYLAIDMEFEQPRDNHSTPDSQCDVATIIQIGWVVYRPDFACRNAAGNVGMLVLSRDAVHVRYDRPLSEYIKKLTGISDADVREGSSLHDVYARLCADVARYQVANPLCQWGSGDVERLREDVMAPGATSEVPVKWQFGRSGFNVKHLYMHFADMRGLKRRGGLATCIKRLGMNWVGGAAHDAGRDAWNTANLHCAILETMRGGATQTIKN